MKRLVVLCFLVACSSRPANGPSNGASDDGVTEEKVTYEKQPDGSIKKTTTRTTRRQVAAPDPPARPADPWPADRWVRYNVERLNHYRAQAGLPALLFDAKISDFARAGSEQFVRDHTPHAHFMANAKGAPGFGTFSAENQGQAKLAKPDDQREIDTILQQMMDEGPGGGHHDNILGPRLRRIGVGLVHVDGMLYLTNDFSN